jgi:putative transposase
MFVGLDGSKALRKAMLAVLDHPVIQRCQLHKIRINRPSRPGSRGRVGRVMAA